MNQPSLLDFPFEQEPAEFLHDAAFEELSRREFFAVAGSGIVVALLAANLQAQRPRGFGGDLPKEIGAWLHISDEGAVTVYTGKVEVGQNIRTSLAQVVAEELKSPIARIRLLMADTAHVPFDMGTFGSQTTPVMAAQLRRVAAASREVLLDLAAEKASLERKTLTIAGGKVTGPGGKPAYDFGQLTRGKKIMKLVSASAATTPADKWTVAGTSVEKVDGRAFVTGGHIYASDVRKPGMLRGKVLRPPAFKATLVSVDVRDAEAIFGVKVIRDGDFVGVVSSSEHDSARALDAIKSKWKTVTHAPQSGKELFEYLKKYPASGRGGRGFGGGRVNRGSVKEALKDADHKLEAMYTIAYIAHVPLEPRASVAEWSDGKLTVWTGTQRPFGVKSELARAFDLGLPSKARHRAGPWARATAASTRVSAPSRPRVWPRAPASRSS